MTKDERARDAGGSADTSVGVEASLRTDDRRPPTAHCPLPTAHCPPTTVHRPPPTLVLGLLLVVAVAAATQLSLWREQSERQQSRGGSVLQVLMGDSRRLFANHFLTKADVYLHSGVYPSIFDQARRAKKLSAAKVAAASSEPSHVTAEGGAQQGQGEQEQEHDHDHALALALNLKPNDYDHHHHHDHAEEPEGTATPDHDEHDAVTGLHGKPRDWIEAFGRNFYPTKHLHLDGERQREILPWLRLAAEMNPNEIETYTVGAYWMRVRMGKVKEAEEFLREGLRANPKSYEILFELGKLYLENRKETERAQHLFELSLKRWEETEAGKKERDDLTMMLITGNLARLERASGHTARAIDYLKRLKEVSPSPEAVQKQIEELGGG